MSCDTAGIGTKVCFQWKATNGRCCHLHLVSFRAHDVSGSKFVPYLDCCAHLTILNKFPSFLKAGVCRVLEVGPPSAL